MATQNVSIAFTVQVTDTEEGSDRVYRTQLDTGDGVLNGEVRFPSLAPEFAGLHATVAGQIRAEILETLADWKHGRLVPFADDAADAPAPG